MKRKTLKLFAGMLGMTVLLSITACGSSDETENTPVTSIAEDATVETEAETKTGTESTGNESQDKAETQTETGAQDKSEAQAETEPQDKSETHSKAETKTESEKGKTNGTEEGTANNSEQYESLEDYFNDPEGMNEWNELSKHVAAASDEFTVRSCDVKGNEIILIFKFKDIKVTDNSISGTNAEYAELMKALLVKIPADSFKEEAKGMDEFIGKEGASTFIMRYTDLDGNVFAEKAFKAD